MKQVLFVNCCIRRELSRTKELADAALAALGTRDDIAVTELCLMDEPLQYFSEGFFAQRERLLAAKELDHPRFRYAHQFAEADADRKSTRLNSSHRCTSRMPSSA